MRYIIFIISGASDSKQYLPSGSDNEGDLGLWLDEEVSLSLSVSLGVNNASFLLLVLLVVFLGILKN